MIAAFEYRDLLFKSEDIQQQLFKQRPIINSIGLQDGWRNLIRVFDSLETEVEGVVWLNNGWFDTVKMKQITVSDELTTTILNILLDVRSNH